jgi:hypothetical protein|nr:MAG TPA: DNA REPAIR HELICASE RAD25, SSL2, PRE-INITIATION COMPLEX, RNA POLYMERASE.0A [Caudoviricetes sp.]
MEKEIENWKNDFECSKKLEELLKNKVFGNDTEELEESKKSEGLKMLDLRTEILYGEKYLEIFIGELVGTDIDESAKKYNIKRINEHLEKILEQYTQITNELDEIIFKDKKNQHICSICGKTYEEYGNNAQPVNNGRCCDKCNATVVIPRRIQEHQNRKETKESNG